MKYQCRVIEEKMDHYVITIKKTAKLDEMPKILSECYSRLNGYLNRIGEISVGAPFVAFLNNDADNLEVEVGLMVRKGIKGSKDIVSKKLPGGKKVSYIHIGAYEGMKPIHENIDKWMEENNYKPAGISYEFYVDDLQDMAEDRMRTKIVMPIA